MLRGSHYRGEYIDLMFRKLVSRAFDAIPSQCAVCHTWPGRPVCEACVTEFAQPQPRCKTCALAMLTDHPRCGACVTHPPVLDACVAAVSYEYPWSDLVSRFKFNSHPGWAASFAHLMRTIPWVEPALDQADIVVPMPLSAVRLRARGFNQAQVLAHALQPDRLEPSILLRIKDTPAQSTQSREERQRAVSDAYAVDPLLLERIQRKRIVLVDDVMTSGASINAAARALRAAGAAHITGLVFARTEM